MLRIDGDIAILGSGFGGSLTALLLERIGLRPVLIDRGSHPRFAIGESSTPAANLVLRDLARTYGLPRLEPLAKYGTWQAAYPNIVCGLKRGFSYFKHLPGVPFVPRIDHANELLVAASGDDLHSDTHWLRSDVDGFLAREVQDAGIAYLDRTEVAVEEHAQAWRLVGRRDGEGVAVTADFLIDATGEAAVIPRAMGVRSEPNGLKTNSRAIFGHFVGVRLWHDLLAESGGCVEDHPFHCDHAALHQMLDEGWMWQLRFNNGVTSAGFVLEAARSPLDPQLSLAEEWSRLLRLYPSIADQFREARLVQTAGGLRRTGRLQRRAEQIVGTNWALLPHTAGFIDPLHSTGIAQTMCGIERLVRVLSAHWGRNSLHDELKHYEDTVLAEIALIDELVHGCYLALRRFDLLVPFTMLYFAAATTYEHRRLAGTLKPGAAFLCADAPRLRAVVRETKQRLSAALSDPDRASAAIGFEQFVASAIAPFNSTGLCDQEVWNMYRYTAVPLDA